MHLISLLITRHFFPFYRSFSLTPFSVVPLFLSSLQFLSRPFKCRLRIEENIVIKQKLLPHTSIHVFKVNDSITQFQKLTKLFYHTSSLVVAIFLFSHPHRIKTPIPTYRPSWSKVNYDPIAILISKSIATLVTVITL